MQLTQRFGGLVRDISCIPHEDGFDNVATAYATLGDTRALFTGKGVRGSPSRCTVAPGVGSGLNRQSARIPAIGEAVERYCISTYAAEQFVVAPATDLGQDALDYRLIAKCNEAEYAKDQCPVRPFDPSAPIRWVRGLDLLSGQAAFVPAIMVYLHMHDLFPGENFWLQNSSGCAAHRSFELAICSAICELVERDVLAVMWLQRLPLPRLALNNTVSPTASAILQNIELQKDYLEYHFFDATSDIGIPCVYGMQIARNCGSAYTLIAASCAPSAPSAFEKVLLDLSSYRTAFRRGRSVPLNIEDFSRVFDGATYMARRDQKDGFSFLFSGQREQTIMEPFEKLTISETMVKILQRFRDLNMHVYAIDVTTDEALRAGYRAVRVIIPELQPISFHYRARFLGHPRVMDAARRMGYASLPSDKINPLPSPFA